LPLSPARLTNANGVLYFVAYDSVHGEELWKVNNTKTGVTLVQDKALGEQYFFPRDMIFVKGRLFMSGSLPEVGQELFSIKLEGGSK
jgi:ELWxxDGT repeat protein